MKLLQNKLTREIGCLVCSFGKTPEKITVVEYIDGKRGSKVWYYDSLAELNEEWCDYEEPKEHFVITCDGKIITTAEEFAAIDDCEEIGNYFKTKEEAEKAVERLRAWRRLRDKGFRFCGHDDRDRGQLGDIVIYAEMSTFEYDDDSTRDDLDLLFGGEE